MGLKINQDEGSPWHERRFIEYDGGSKVTTLAPIILFATLDMFLLYGGMLLIYLL